MRLSPNGRVMTAWCTSHSPQGVIYAHISSSDIKLHYEHKSLGYILPLPNTVFAVTGTGEMINSECNVVRSIKQPLIPDISGSYFMAMLDGGRLDFYASKTSKLIKTVTIASFKPGKVSRSWDKTEFTADRKIFLNLGLKTLVHVSENKNEVIFHTIK